MVDGDLQLGLDAVEQVAVGVAEGADALALELRRGGGQVDARLRGASECLLGRGGAGSNARVASPWSAKARRVASGMVLMTSVLISSST